MGARIVTDVVEGVRVVMGGAENAKAATVSEAVVPL